MAAAAATAAQASETPELSINIIMQRPAITVNPSHARPRRRALKPHTGGRGREITRGFNLGIIYIFRVSIYRYYMIPYRKKC